MSFANYHVSRLVDVKHYIFLLHAADIKIETVDCHVLGKSSSDYCLHTSAKIFLRSESLFGGNQRLFRSGGKMAHDRVLSPFEERSVGQYW